MDPDPGFRRYEGRTLDRRAVGGDDRAPAGQKGLGEFRARRGDGPVIRGLGALSASGPLRWVLLRLPQMRITHATAAKMHTARRNFAEFPLGGAAVCRSYRGGCMAGLRERGEEGPRERVFQRLVLGVPLHA